MRIIQNGREQIPSHAEEADEHYSAEEEAPRNFADKAFLKFTQYTNIQVPPAQMAGFLYARMGRMPIGCQAWLKRVK